MNDLLAALLCLPFLVAPVATLIAIIVSRIQSRDFCR
jgi:hypothetical protein